MWGTFQNDFFGFPLFESFFRFTRVYSVHLVTFNQILALYNKKSDAMNIGMNNNFAHLLPLSLISQILMKIMEVMPMGF